MRAWCWAKTASWPASKIVVSAGGTHEAIDPVRFIGNRSSGKQGFAIAQAAIDRGAEVTLIVGASALPTPYGAKRIDVESAQEMCEAVLAACRDADALIMAAAVADFQAAQLADHKIKKTKDTVEFDIHLTRTPDILQAVKEQKRNDREAADHDRVCGRDAKPHRECAD